MKTGNEKYIDRMARDLKEWSATIDEYEIRTSRLSIDRQSDYDIRLRDLKEKRDLLSSRLLELRKTGSGGTVPLTGVEAAKRELRDAFAAARDTIKTAA